jgi:hypothetical protein
VFVIIVLCIVLSVYVLFCVFCVLYCVVLWYHCHRVQTHLQLIIIIRFRKCFRGWGDIPHLILSEIKADITKVKKNKYNVLLAIYIGSYLTQVAFRT